MVCSLSLHPLFHLNLSTTAPIEFPRPQAGAKRSICYFTRGEFSGAQLSGRLLTGGGDWADFHTSDLFDIDVRAMLACTDGALIEMRYAGLWRAAEGALDKVFGPEGASHYKPNEHYVRVAARFETATPAYRWINAVLAIGIGAPGPDNSVSYDFYDIV